MLRVHRLAAMFAGLGFFMPYVPRILNFPRVPMSCFGMRYGDSQCAMLALGFIGLALVFACFGARGMPRRAYWSRVAAVGLGWVVSIIVFPVP